MTYIVTKLFKPGDDVSAHKDGVGKFLNRPTKTLFRLCRLASPELLARCSPTRFTGPCPSNTSTSSCRYVLVAQIENKTVGFLSFTTDFTHDSITQYPSCVYVDTVAVNPVWRRVIPARSFIVRCGAHPLSSAITTWCCTRGQPILRTAH